MKKLIGGLIIVAVIIVGVTGAYWWFDLRWRPETVVKHQLEIANVFAGLFSVIIIGLFVENFIFRNIELKTVRKWGMQS